eukprot:CAMPEP_0170242362 /NCGR_PEP_ID=MMETSP0116_2-20130129/20952_1 /TAXON_ID=400756 /ORGANISM="Durinskia baltica, Strain CSIRO CS-38" /LENGTH=69 /DNA_ID=CAMNT_0010493207 /DNA_START=12 /DNA_END=218 /DNA_ORIENTATION=+
MSSPTFFGDMPRGPTFGASTDEGACSPPYCRSVTTLTSFGSNFGAMFTIRGSLVAGGRRCYALTSGPLE